MKIAIIGQQDFSCGRPTALTLLRKWRSPGQRRCIDLGVRRRFAFANQIPASPFTEILLEKESS